MMKFILASQKLFTLISYSHSRHNGSTMSKHLALRRPVWPYCDATAYKSAKLTIIWWDYKVFNSILYLPWSLPTYPRKRCDFICVYLPLNSELAMAPHGATGFLFFPLSLTNVNGSQSDEGVSKRRPSSWLSSLYKKKFKVYYSC